MFSWGQSLGLRALPSRTPNIPVYAVRINGGRCNNPSCANDMSAARWGGRLVLSGQLLLSSRDYRDKVGNGPIVIQLVPTGLSTISTVQVADEHVLTWVA